MFSQCYEFVYEHARGREGSSRRVAQQSEKLSINATRRKKCTYISLDK